ncbi:MAG: tripartite tricarboxylate transporter substrate binding protein [Burkholderiales bacterium]|nr:tripartite tricarboxylate transporter substrate binding protein [Burkholderiales bacterium]
MTWMTRLAVCLVLLSSAAAPVVAQPAADFPTRRITFVVPFTPGGAGDLIARALAPRLAALWGQSVVVENRAGAGGNVGSRTVAVAAPDGHTILIGSTSSHAINPSLYREKMPYDVQRDFAHVVMVANSPHILMMHPSLPATSIPELIAYVRANPGQVHFSSGGNGTSTHLAGELFNSMAGVRMVHVPFRGAPEAVAGVMGGTTQLMFENLAGALVQVRTGRLKGLAVTSLRRSPQAPELPTVADSVAGFETGVWFGVFAPAATPPGVVARINADMNAALRSKEVREQFDRLGMEPMGGTSADATAFVRAETVKWAKVVAASNAKID